MKEKMFGRSSVFTKYLKIVLLMGLMILCSVIPVYAAENAAENKTENTTDSAAVKKTPTKNVWVEKKGYYYYKNAKGKNVTGVKKIKGRYYMFDSKGRQKTGWRKIKGKYYFFKIAGGEEGYRLSSTKVNGLKLNKQGAAVVKTANQKLKAQTLYQYATWVDSFIKPTMTDKQKLNACLKQLKKFGFKPEGPAVLKKSNWDVVCASEFYERRKTSNKGNCYRFASAFAYMANAIGYKKVQVCAHDGHGWTKIDGNVYDLTYAINIGKKYFPVPKKKANIYSASAKYIRDLRKF